MRRLQAITPQCVATAAYLAACLVLGGGTRSGFLPDVALQVLAVPLALWSAWRLLDVPQSAGGGRGRAIMVVCLMAATVPVAQLVPLPPALWTLLPARTDFVQTLEAAGLEVGWMPLSMVPRGTWLSALALLPPVAVLLSVVQLGFADRRRIALVVLIVGVAGAMLGLVQVAQGPASPLRIYAFTNPTEAVGFFANRNHYAALLNCLLPLAAAWSIAAMLRAARAGSWRSRHQTPHWIVAMIGLAALVVLVSAQIVARSRAGLGVMLIALLGSLAMIYALPSSRPDTEAGPPRSAASGIVVGLLAGLIGLAVVIGFHPAFNRLEDRFAGHLLADGRIPMARNTINAAMTYMPFGSGMGTFVHVYQAFESASDGFTFSYVNHAHNDFLELWLEAGLAGLLAILVFLSWAVLTCLRVWWISPPGAERIDTLLACGATLILGTLLMHSCVDYPLRTTALMALFAVAVGLLIAPVGAERLAAAPLVKPASAGEEGVSPEPPAASARSGDFRAAAPPRGEWPLAWRLSGKSGRSEDPR